MVLSPEMASKLLYFTSIGSHLTTADAKIGEYRAGVDMVLADSLATAGAGGPRSLTVTVACQGAPHSSTPRKARRDGLRLRGDQNIFSGQGLTGASGDPLG